MLDFWDRTRTGISILTPAADSLFYPDFLEKTFTLILRKDKVGYIFLFANGCLVSVSPQEFSLPHNGLVFYPPILSCPLIITRTVQTQLHYIYRVNYKKGLFCSFTKQYGAEIIPFMKYLGLATSMKSTLKQIEAILWGHCQILNCLCSQRQVAPHKVWRRGNKTKI